MFRTLLLAIIVMAGVSLSVPAQEKPLLADELREAFAAEGVDGMSRKFDEIWPAAKSSYDTDPAAIMAFLQELSQSGDMEAMAALADINGIVMQDTLNRQMLGAGVDYQDHAAILEAGVEDQVARDGAIQDEVVDATSAQSLGSPREDLDRFAGLYAKVGDPPAKSVFVSQTCDGYLAASPLWADLAPWRLRSAADTVFTYSDSFMTFAMEFQLDENGHGRAFSHDIDGMDTPLQRIGDLPVEYADCLEAPKR